MKTKLGLLVIAILSLAAGDTADAKKELEKFAGTWESSELIYNGKEHKLKFKIVFKGDQGVVQDNEKVTNEYARIKFQLDSAAKPRAMDITIVAGSQTDAKLEGIYELKGDELRICAKVFGNDRPTEFAAPDGSSIVLLTLKRAP